MATPQIEFSSEYSSDKSKIKDIFRERPLCDGIELVNDMGDTGVAPTFAGEVRTIFEDASVRLAQGPSGPNSSDLYQSFADTVKWHFLVFPDAHTYVMAFDDKRHVPNRKRAAQLNRRESLHAAMERRLVPPWSWDGVARLMNTTEDTPLPPWERLRADSAAYARIVEELATELERSFVPPPGRRLIIDYGRRVSVVEAANDGRVLMPRQILADKPDIGEGDMAALYYSRRARHSCYSHTDLHSITTDELYERRPLIDSDLLLSYYDESMTTLAPDQQLLPKSLRPLGEPIDKTLLRRVYEAGAVVLRTVDTDFLSLSLTCLAGSDEQSYSNNIYLALGRVHRLENKYVTRSIQGAVAHQEYYDMRTIYQRLCTMHEAPERCLETAWSFVAFCIACGNDYTKRLHNLSHKTMFSAYKRTISARSQSSSSSTGSSGNNKRRRMRLVNDFATSSEIPAVALLDVDAFIEVVRHAYYERLPEKRRPVHGAVPQWRELKEIVQDAFPKNERAHMPSFDALSKYHDQVAWSLAYASGASYGKQYLP